MPAAGVRWDPVRTGKIVAIVGIAVPTLLILGVMSGVIEYVRAANGFPFIAIGFDPPALLAANTPSGGDMGAHVFLPQYLKETLLPSGRILGWSNAWYAGFPALYFYFPLPALATVVLDMALPYGVAFKITTVLGLVALPSAVYFLVRSMGFARVVAGIAAAVGGSYVFMESFSIFGGNIKSTLAGEYSFSWSFALSIVYLGMVIRDTRDGRGFTPRAGIVLALTALSHVVTTIVVVVVSLPLLVRRNGPATLLRAWSIGLAVSAFWALPLGVRVLQGMTSDMNWSPVRGLIGNGSTPGTVATPLPNELIPLLAVGLVGLAWTLLRRDDIAVLLTMTVLPFVGYWYLQLPDIEITKVYNARLLPYWYLGVYIFAGIAVGLAVRTLARYLPQHYKAVGLVAGVALFLVANLAIVGVHDAPGWVRWNYTGYEGKAGYSEYAGLIAAVDELPPGRIMWEANNDMGRYGTPMALMLLPYWSEDHPSMEGLFFESSLTTPFHFLNASEVSRHPSNPVRGLDYRSLDFERAILHLQLYNVAYYVAFTPDAADLARTAGLEELAAPAPWTIFRLPESSLVDVAASIPAVYDGEETFLDASLEWYDDYRNLDSWLVADGPQEWPRVTEVADRLGLDAPYDVTAAEVTDVEIDNHRIAFDTTAIGVPHLVKVSYFPAWRVEGAAGPFQAAPSLMVVVPTEEHVVLEFANGVPENAGMVLSSAMVLGLAGWAGLRWRRRR